MKSRKVTLIGSICLSLILAALPFMAACAKPAPAPTPAKPIVIGAPLATGFLYGWDAQRAMTLAVDEINAAGGVNVGGAMRPFQLVVMDTRDLEPTVPISDALAVVQKLILEQGADFIVGGPVRSEAALAAMDLFAQYKKVAISTTGCLSPAYSAAVAKNYDKYKYCFRITGEAGWMVNGEIVPCLVDIGKKFGLNNIFIMIQDVAHARAGGGLIQQLMPKQGWTVSGFEIYPTGTTDFSPGLLKAKAAGAQVVLMWMDMPESSILLEQFNDLKIPALPFGSILSAAEQPSFWDATSGKAAYSTADVVNAGNAASNCTPLTMKFFNAYQARWAVEPEGFGCSSSYQAIYTLKDAIERAGTLDSDAVIKALEATKMVGVYGLIQFDPKSHQVIPSLDPSAGAVGTIFQWQAGKRVVIFPSSIATGSVQLPPTMGK